MLLLLLEPPYVFVFLQQGVRSHGNQLARSLQHRPFQGVQFQYAHGHIQSYPIPLSQNVSHCDQHHHLLKTVLKRSTPKIERMIDAARAAGALGCKINGSGGGGTMLALAPGKEMEVAQAIRGAGGRPYHVKIGSGAEIEEV